MTWLLGAIIVVLAVVLLRAMRELSRMRRRYKPVVDVEKERDRVATERDRLTTAVKQQRTAWKAEFEQTVTELKQLTDQLVSVRDQVAMESFGLYEPQFDFDDPEDYKQELKSVQDAQRAMVRGKTAAVCQTEWQVEGSKAKGRAMVNRQLRLMLRAFNGECDAAIGKVKYSNVMMLEKRIERAFAAINKLGAPQNCAIVERYRRLKLSELRIVHELRERQQEIREEQRAIRQQMREEERARKEIQKAQADAEKEERRYDNALAKARAEVAVATGDKQERLTGKIADLENRLEEAQKAKERAIARAQLTKSGHVYVVSNIGSFGKDTYKIGMTRRLDPIDRVKELSGASVPFPFDVHAMIYSKDAPTLETALHHEFAERRVNRVNNRKEFFYVNLDEIVQAVEDKVDDNVAEVNFTKAAAAEEYRRTLAMIDSERKSDEPDAGDTARQSLEQRIRSWETAGATVLD